MEEKSPLLFQTKLLHCIQQPTDLQMNSHIPRSIFLQLNHLHLHQSFIPFLISVNVRQIKLIHYYYEKSDCEGSVSKEWCKGVNGV